MYLVLVFLNLLLLLVCSKNDLSYLSSGVAMSLPWDHDHSSHHLSFRSSSCFTSFLKSRTSSTSGSFGDIIFLAS